ncbi:MAG: BlaI/MecI/CopY family transcriptional regulator [Acidobacteria bacterium]|nr:BlaI/MecI/CopY family transcriptional regulator [Acidobacteriota bacterium]
MARRRSTVFTDGELRIMRVLWERGRATVAEVVDAIVLPRKPAYNTVLTMLGILEEKGYVRHEKAGRAFAYVPLVDRAEARQTALSSLLQRFFDNSPELLVANLIERGTIGRAELDKARALVDAPAPPRGGRRKESGE